MRQTSELFWQCNSITFKGVESVTASEAEQCCTLKKKEAGFLLLLLQLLLLLLSLQCKNTKEMEKYVELNSKHISKGKEY